MWDDLTRYSQKQTFQMNNRFCKLTISFDSIDQKNESRKMMLYVPAAGWVFTGIITNLLNSVDLSSKANII